VADDIYGLLSGAGMTRYEIQVYLSMMRWTVDSASKLSEDSGVPRTKVYRVLESLQDKGWIRVLSGRPLLYRIVDVPEVLEQLRREHEAMLQGLNGTLEREAGGMLDKVVVINRSVGLDGLKEHLQGASRVNLSHITWDLYDRVREDMDGASEVRAMFFPGEAPPSPRGHEEFRLSQVKVVHMVRGMETPASQVIVDEDRIFTITHDPLTKRYEVDEMFDDGCVGCLKGYFDLGWNASPPAPSAPPAER
jgi:sugar-specific transcriptional regulator TrmB